MTNKNWLKYIFMCITINNHDFVKMFFHLSFGLTQKIQKVKAEPIKLENYETLRSFIQTTFGAAIAVTNAVNNNQFLDY